MSHLCRLVPRTATNLFYVSRMNAHNLAPGTPVKVDGVKNGHHIVSGSGQFIATDGPNATTRTGIGGGSSASMLPGAQTAEDKTNPTKTTGDSREHRGKTGPGTAHQSILTSPIGLAGIAVVAVVSIYAAYQILGGNASDKSAKFQDKQAREAVNPSIRTKEH